jgi:hypothetical protein
MDLQMQLTLLGEPFPGQCIEIDTKDGVTHGFTCSPHGKYFNYVWLLSNQKPKMIEQFFPKLRATWETTWRPNWYKIYIDCEKFVAVNCPVYLRAVPEGIGFAKDETSMCLGAVAAIRIL